MKVVVNDTTKSAAATQVMASYGTTPGLIGRAYGIDVDAAGNFWVTDSFNSVLHKYSKTGVWIADYGQGLFRNDLREWRGTTPAAWCTWPTRQSQIVKFTTGGATRVDVGVRGLRPGQFGGGPRQITIDKNGNIWAADYGNFRVNVYDPDGNLLDTAPAPARAPCPASVPAPRRDVDRRPVTCGWPTPGTSGSSSSTRPASSSARGAPAAPPRSTG